MRHVHIYTMHTFTSVAVCILFQVKRNENASTKNAVLCPDGAINERDGMSDEKVGSMQLIVMSQGNLSNEASGLQMVNEEISELDDTYLQEISSNEAGREVSVSRVVGKRNFSGEILNELCKSPKKARVASSSKNDQPCECDVQIHRLKNQINDLNHKVKSLQKRLKSSQQKTRRGNKKVSTLAAVVSELKEKNLIHNECASMLETTFSGVPKELMKRLVSQKKKKNLGAYPPELRSFALTLKFYSTKAYNYVRKSFDLGLPHVSVIRSWYSSIDGEPGFTKDALTALKAKVLAAKRDNQEIVCALMLDEMSIRKHVEWDGKRFRGFVDLGTGIDDDSLPEATDALVFMAVSVNSS